MSLPFVRSSLRAKVTIGVVLPLVLILSIFTTIEYLRRRAVLLSNLSFFATYSAQVIEDNLLHQMLEADFAGVQQLLDTISEREEFQTVYILDTSGKVVFAPSGADVGMQLDNKQPDCQPCHRLPPEARPESVAVTNAAGQRVFRSMHPFEYRPACGQCHDPEERLIGLLLTDISTAPVEASLVADLRENALWWIGTILVTVLVVNLVISRFVLRRLEGLASAIARFGQSTLPPLENGSDEIGQLTNSFNIMARRVEKRRQENRVLSERLRRQSVQRGELLRRLITAQEDERKRVARELHDDLGQTLSGLTLRVEVMGRFLKSDHNRAFEQLEQIQSLIAATTAQMYNIILDLRPSILDDLGLVPALRAYAERLLEHSDLQFELEADTFRHRLPAEVETALFRVFQEALNNTVRHAGATCVRAVLTCQNNIFTGEIVDNGRGFDLESINLNGHSPRGLGLLGMQERMMHCGGQLEICSRPGQGTCIKIRIPLEVCCD